MQKKQHTLYEEYKLKSDKKKANCKANLRTQKTKTLKTAHQTNIMNS